MSKRKIVIKSKSEEVPSLIAGSENDSASREDRDLQPFWSTKTILIMVAIALISGALTYGLISLLAKEKIVETSMTSSPRDETQTKVSRMLNKYKLGFDPEEYAYERTTADSKMDLGSFLERLELKGPDIKRITADFRQKNLDTIYIGDRITYFFKDDLIKKTDAVIIEPYAEKRYWYKLDVKNGLLTQKYVKPVEFKKKETACVLTSSRMIQAVFDCDIHYELISKMEEILKWSVDFYHIQAGDKFKVIYDEKYIDGQLVGVGRIYALEFHHRDELVEVIGLKKQGQELYFTENGRSLERKFLKSPIKFGRISSRFNPDRLHPTLGVIKPHGGTDYAAPEGTPVLSVADGQVVRKASTPGSGNLIEIRHDNVYTTKYLHLSGYAPGMQPGRRVKQGEVIAYVGQTGRNITGPHVCFRFLKNGVERDHLRLKLPTGGRKIEGKLEQTFKSQRDTLNELLAEIDW